MHAPRWYDRFAVSEEIGRRLGPVALIAGVVALVVFGLAGATREVRWLEDYYWFYAAGRGWIEGVSPYTRYSELWQQLYGATPRLPAIAYPPQAAVPFMAFAWMPLPSAQVAWVALNLAGLLSVAALAVAYVRRARIWRPSAAYGDTQWLLPAFVLLLPFTWTAIWLGQPTPILVALVMGGWLAARERHDVMAGILLGLATFKPQFVVLVTLWLLLDRRWTLLLALGATSLAMASYVLITLGPLDAVQGWLGAVAAYGDIPFNTLGSFYVLGLPSTLTAVGLSPPGPGAWLPVAGAVVTALYFMRRRLTEDDLLGILMGVHLFVVYGHGHELLFLTPLITGLWLHLRHRPAVWLLCFGAALIAVPERLVGLLEIDLLMHWKTALVLIGLLALLRLSASAARVGRDARIVGPQRAEPLEAA